MTTAIDTPGGPVSALYDGPEDAEVLVVLAHGAGANLNHDFMATMAGGFAAGGVRVCRFNFLYTEAGRKSPDRQNVLEDTYRGVVSHLLTQPHRILVAGGKSLGGRIASHIAAGGEDVDGLLFLGYPLHPPGRPERLRDEHLYAITAPMLFVEGTRDPFCPLEALEKVRAGLSAPTEVAVIEDGDHSFRVRKSSGRSTDDALGEVIARSLEWLHALG